MDLKTTGLAFAMSAALTGGSLGRVRAEPVHHLFDDPAADEVDSRDGQRWSVDAKLAVSMPVAVEQPTGREPGCWLSVGGGAFGDRGGDRGATDVRYPIGALWVGGHLIPTDLAPSLSLLEGAADGRPMWGSAELSIAFELLPTAAWRAFGGFAWQVDGDEGICAGAECKPEPVPFVGLELSLLR